MKVPTVKQAEHYLAEAKKLNSGTWVCHSIVSGNCAKIISSKCKDLNPDISQSLGMLHDIGRRYGISDMQHTYLGYKFMLSQGYEDCARICLTHSFPYKHIDSYSGKADCTDYELNYIKTYLESTDYNDYDKLIQLCDVLSMSTGAVFIEKRLIDVTIRKGFNDLTIKKWKAFLDLKTYFDELTGINIYKLLNIEL